MKINSTLAAIALAFAPGLALAQGCGHGMAPKDETASSCIAGSTWDEAKATCVTNPSS